jgi:hypothetical protein
VLYFFEGGGLIPLGLELSPSPQTGESAPFPATAAQKKNARFSLTFCNTSHPADVLALVLHPIPFYGKVHFYLDIHRLFFVWEQSAGFWFFTCKISRQDISKKYSHFFHGLFLQKRVE